MLLVLLGSCPALLSYTAPGGVAEAPRLESMSAAKAAEVRWWRLQRLKLLALNDRLETCMVGVAGVGAGLWAVFRDCRKVVFQTGPVDRHRVVYAGEQGTGLCWGAYGGCAGDGEDLRLQCMPEAPPVQVPACINSPSFQQRNGGWWLHMPVLSIRTCLSAVASPQRYAPCIAVLLAALHCRHSSAAVMTQSSSQSSEQSPCPRPPQHWQLLAT